MIRFLINTSLILGAILLVPELHNRYILRQARAVARVTNEFGGGTGFAVVAASGTPVLITAAHVCIAFPPHTYKKIDFMHDLCVLNAPAPPHFLYLATSIDPYEHVYMLGYPNLETLTLTEGRLANYFYFEEFHQLYLMAAMLGLHGNSGSPVLNTWGHVIGMAVVVDHSTRWGLVPLKDIKAFLSDL